MLWAWVSRTAATVRSVRRMSSTTFTNVFFKIGKDETRLMSLSQRVLLETGYEILQLFVL